MAGLGGTPVLILREGSRRTRGRDAQKSNIMAARAVANAVRTTLGPQGMDKMLVDAMGDVIITNDGVTILKEMEIEDPAAKMMVEVARTQDDEVGDGTTTAVVLAGELLERADNLLDEEIHPTVIAAGYRDAAEKAIELLRETAMEVGLEEEVLLKRIAITSMSGKGSSVAREALADLALAAIKSIVDDNGTADVENVTVEKKVGGKIDDSELVRGMVIDKGRLSRSMPKRVSSAKVALLGAAIEIEKTEFDSEIEIKSPDQLAAFLDQEELIYRKMVEGIVNAGANVVFCEKGIDDLAQHFLAKAGVYAARRVKKSDMEKLARATGGRIVTSLHDIAPDDLGRAGMVEERKIAGEEMTFVLECENPKSVSIILRGGSEHVVDELDRAMEDGLRVLEATLIDRHLVPGGGAPEIELALRLREYAATVGGREQLAIEAFSEALEIIPKTLAENAGFDQIDTLVALRSEHERGAKSAGLDTETGGPADMIERGIVDPLKVKVQAINSAAEAAAMIIRIDDVIASKSSGFGAGGGGSGLPGGMGGMGEEL